MWTKLVKRFKLRISKKHYKINWFVNTKTCQYACELDLKLCDFVKNNLYKGRNFIKN